MLLPLWYVPGFQGLEAGGGLLGSLALGLGTDGCHILLLRQGDDPPAALRQVEVLLLELLEAVGNDQLGIEDGVPAGIFTFSQGLRLAEPLRKEG